VRTVGEWLVRSTLGSAVCVPALCSERLCAGATGVILEIAWKDLGCNRFQVEG